MLGKLRWSGIACKSGIKPFAIGSWILLMRSFFGSELSSRLMIELMKFSLQWKISDLTLLLPSMELRDVEWQRVGSPWIVRRISGTHVSLTCSYVKI